MKLFPLTSLLTAGLVLALPVLADTYSARSGSLLKIEGTSTVHDWTVESKLIGGSMELKGDLNKAGKVDATAKIVISATSLKSGKPPMDDIMHGALKATEHPRCEFILKELIAKGDMKFDATGDFTLAGTTKEVKFPVTMEPREEGAMKVKGVFETKMTDFKIDPPAPKVALGAITTGDEVKVTFEWMTRKK